MKRKPLLFVLIFSVILILIFIIVSFVIYKKNNLYTITYSPTSLTEESNKYTYQIDLKLKKIKKTKKTYWITQLVSTENVTRTITEIEVEELKNIFNEIKDYNEESKKNHSIFKEYYYISGGKIRKKAIPKDSDLINRLNKIIE